MIDPETVLAIVGLLIVASLILLAVLTGLTFKVARRQYRIMAQNDDVLQASQDAAAQLQTLIDQQAKTSASILAAIARVEAIITALQNTNDPKLEAAINSLHSLKDTLAGAVVAEQQEQSVADAERPVAPPA